MRIFLLGATPSFDVGAHLTIAGKLAQTGGNTGNQLIAYGLLKSLAYDEVDWDHAKGPQYVDENFDVILIAAANFLFPGFDFGGMAEFISKTKLPVVMVGLGAQSKDYSPKIELKPGTSRLMSIVAERTKLIGVRGPFTRDVLANLGIHNVQVVGCPSYYMNGPEPPPLRKGPLPDRPRIAINASRDVLGHAFDRDKMRNAVFGLTAEAVRYDGTFVAQTEREEMILAERPGSPEAAGALTSLAAFFSDAAVDAAAFRSWAERRMRVYWSVEAWLEDMKSLDFVVGTRFHGAMAPLKIGTPAFVLCHDTRTTEMSKFLGLPHANIVELDRIDLKELYDRVDVDAIGARWTELLPLYRQFLATNGLRYRY